jgi:hypothetical protein
VSRRADLRFGTLLQLQNLLDERAPANFDEVRAVVMNLIDHLQLQDRELDRFAERLGEVSERTLAARRSNDSPPPGEIP